MHLFGGILTIFFSGNEREDARLRVLFPAAKDRESGLDSPRAFLLIAAFGQFGGNGSQCAEQTSMSLVGAGGEE